jgi:hypothetical protein
VLTCCHQNQQGSHPVSDFIAKAPTIDANWRAIVLFGRNVASYKFALAKSLLEFATRPADRVTIEELALPYARHLCSHLAKVDTQSTSPSSSFLDACRKFNRDGDEQALVDKAARLGFVNVIDAFHVVGRKPVPVRFFVDERGGSRADRGAIRITDQLRRLTEASRDGELAAEAEARWRLVETSWELDLPRAGVEVQADVGQDLLFVESDRKIRRTDLTKVRDALSGYQRGRCFYCRCRVSLALSDVDHFFPWVLKPRGTMPDVDRVWNLVIACRSCNRGRNGKFDAVPSGRLVERLHERNNWLVDSHHPLRETVMIQTGVDAAARAAFLRDRQLVARNSLIHEWEPESEALDRDG